MNQRGQLSFEVAILVVLIFLLTFLAAGQYFQVHDTTYAVAKLKAATIAELGTLDKQHAIKRIDYQVGEAGKSLSMQIYGDPKFGKDEVAYLKDNTTLDDVCKDIMDATVFKNAVSINFDGEKDVLGKYLCTIQVAPITGP
ncbi:MAG: hypothetical protein V1676_01585 [Candidatus Diapherotrites archaeon]